MGKLGVKLNKNVFNTGREKLAEGGDYNDVQLEPGRYVCVLVKGRAQEVKGSPKIVFDLKVAGESDKAGGRISVWFDLGEDRIVHLMRLLDKIGYDVSDLDEDKLAEILEDVEANPKVVRVTAKQGGEYVNYYIDKLIEDLSPTEALGGAVGGESAADKDAAGGKAGLKPGVGKKKAAAEPEPEPEAEPEEVELKVGMKVTVTIRGKDIPNAVVKTIDEKAGKVKVQLPDKSLATVGADQIAV